MKVRRMRWSRRILSVAGIGIMLVLTVFLDRLVNMDRQNDPTDKRTMEATDIYRDLGYSELILLQDEREVIYEDRKRTRFSTADIQERASYLTKVWERMCEHIPENIVKYVIPLPTPILYEDGYEEDQKAYQEYVSLLYKNLNPDTEVLDISESLKIHADEGIFYRYLDSLSNRGGYYAAEVLFERTGEKELPMLSEYYEELYSIYGEGDAIDPTYLYTLPNSQNFCEVFRKNNEGEINSNKCPVIIKRGQQGGSVVAGGSYEWAAIEGDGTEGAVLFLADSSGKAMAPYLANCYRKVIIVSMNWGEAFGSKAYSIENFLEEYGITTVILAQDSSKMGTVGESHVLNKFMK